jgi:NAD(P)-dependent dehydrogenase (short-subunit alcohol dehydrogenase family)
MTFGSEFRATCQSRSANALVSGIAACPPAAAPVSRSRIKRLLSWAGENLGRFRQAGVRHSLNEPHAYVDANLVGFLNVLEGCRHSQCRHLHASSSSVYGANRHMPFRTSDNVDHPLNLYGATKKANELMAHAYAHEVEQVVRLIEQILGKSAIRELLPMQPGNVLETYADVSALCEAVGSPPRSWLGRPQAGVAILQQLSQQNGFAQEMISALEERAIWSRYGL